MTDRDRLAADLHEIACGASARSEWDLCVRDHRHEADRLIALGWTRLDEERLARALADRRTWTCPEDCGDSQWGYCRHEITLLAKAYREDTE